jgi:hypothetical protein
VPAAETAVATLGLLGLHRWAAAGALMLLAGFSGALLARWRDGERRLRCGCFGGAEDLHVGAALARNGALAAIATTSWAAPQAPARWWPGVPAGADVLPAVLAVAGLAAALAIALAGARALRSSA